MSGYSINRAALDDYFTRMISRFFKILPMWESGEKTLKTYMESLSVELSGSRNVLGDAVDCADFISLAAILQYFIEHPDSDTGTVRREVFRAISLCDAIKAKCEVAE